MPIEDRVVMANIAHSTRVNSRLMYVVSSQSHESEKLLCVAFVVSD